MFACQFFSFILCVKNLTCLLKVFTPVGQTLCFRPCVSFMLCLKLGLILSLSLLFHIRSEAQAFSPSVGGRALAMGGSGVALRDEYAVYNNQAALSGLSEISLGISYHFQYHMDEFSERSLSLIYPSAYGVWFASIVDYGFSAYRETKLGLGFSRSFGPNLSMALQLDLLNTIFSSDQSSISSYTFEMGLVYCLGSVDLGFHIFNPTGLDVETFYSKERVEPVSRLGVVYSIDDKTLLSSEFCYVVGEELLTQLGMEYKMSSKVDLRGGLAGLPLRYSLGTGVKLQGVQLDFASSFHQYVGFSSTLSMVFRW